MQNPYKNHPHGFSCGLPAGKICGKQLAKILESALRIAKPQWPPTTHIDLGFTEKGCWRMQAFWKFDLPENRRAGLNNAMWYWTASGWKWQQMQVQQRTHVFLFSFVKSILILTYAILTSHKPVVLTPYEKWSFSWGFSPRPYMFPTQALDYRQLSVQFLMFGSSFRSNFGGKNGAHVFFLKCSEGWWLPEFQFFWVDFYINQKMYKNIAK